MRTIKIKLPFSSETITQRTLQLIEMAQILTNNEFFTIIEEKHFPTMSYIVVIVEQKVELKQKAG